MGLRSGADSAHSESGLPTSTPCGAISEKGDAFETENPTYALGVSPPVAAYRNASKPGVKMTDVTNIPEDDSPECEACRKAIAIGSFEVRLNEKITSHPSATTRSTIMCLV